jgi:uncharacterized protein YbbC (DUF1343 family)
MVKVAYEQPPYEYVYDRNPFDVIAGTASIREMIEIGGSLEELQSGWQKELEVFKKVREEYLLY